jgi:hypothetical protein
MLISALWNIGCSGPYPRALALVSEMDPKKDDTTTPRTSEGEKSDAVVEGPVVEEVLPSTPPSRTQNVHPRRTYAPFILAQDAPRGAIYAFQALLGYTLMLSVMLVPVCLTRRTANLQNVSGRSKQHTLSLSLLDWVLERYFLGGCVLLGLRSTIEAIYGCLWRTLLSVVQYIIRTRSEVKQFTHTRHESKETHLGHAPYRYLMFDMCPPHRRGYLIAEAGQSQDHSRVKTVEPMVSTRRRVGRSIPLDAQIMYGTS